MKKKSLLFYIAISLLYPSCKESKDTPSSIAKKWCELNGKIHITVEGPEKEAARVLLKQYQNEMEARYKEDEPFMKEIEKEVNKCENASELR